MGRHLCLRRRTGGPGGQDQRRGHAVAQCGAGDGFCGVVLARARDGGACTVALGGMVTVSCTSAPAVGWAKLSADGSGGVKADEGGREYLVVRSESNNVTFVL